MTSTPEGVAVGPSVRDHVRGALLALVLLAHGVYALPLPQAVPERRIAEEGFQRDVDGWLGVLARIGVHPQRSTLERGVVDVTRALHDVHVWLKAPFAPVMDLVGANQAWALFASTSTHPDRLEVSVRRGPSTEWETVLRRLDPCCTWREPMLEYRRIRGVWDGQHDTPRAAYKGLTRWIAGRAFADFPDATEVRIRLLRSTLVYPWEPANPAIEIQHERVVRRPRPGTGP